MENKNVGWLILGISALIIFVIFLYKSALEQISASGCSMEKALCPMNKTIDQQTYLALAIVGILIVIGIVLIFSKPKEKIVIKKVKQLIEAKRKPINYNTLNKEEKSIVETLEQAEGTLFQSDIVDKTGFDKVKVTRILDRLEGKQLIERKRRGMTNVVILK